MMKLNHRLVNRLVKVTTVGVDVLESRYSYKLEVQEVFWGNTCER